MALYSFTQIDLPDPPPAAPGTDFQDLATQYLAGVDDSDALVSAGLAQAALDLAAGSADLDGLGQDIVDAQTTLQVMIDAAAADDITAEILAAIEQDNGIAALSGSVLSGLSSLAPDLLNFLSISIFPYLSGEIDSIIIGYVESIDAELENLAQEVEMLTGAYGTGPFGYG